MGAAYDVWVGIDWAMQRHQVCLLSIDGTVLKESVVEHRSMAIRTLIEQLVRYVDGKADRIAAAIEISRGALVDALLESGIHVYALNPKQLDRFRDRHSVAGAKDDRLDAYVLADALRTDLPRFRRVDLDHPLILQIREISRAEEDLVEELRRLTNRLREQTYRWKPQLLSLAPAADEPWFWDFLERLVRQPRARMTVSQIDALLRRHRIRKLKSEEIRRSLAEPSLQLAPGAMEAAKRHIALLLPRLHVAHQQRKGSTKQLQELLAEYTAEEEDQHGGLSDVSILLSAPGVGLSVAATILAEARRPLAERDLDPSGP